MSRFGQRQDLSALAVEPRRVYLPGSLVGPMPERPPDYGTNQLDEAAPAASRMLWTQLRRVPNLYLLAVAILQLTLADYVYGSRLATAVPLLAVVGFSLLRIAVEARR